MSLAKEDQAESTDVLYEIEDGLAVITINPPKVINAFRSRTNR